MYCPHKLKLEQLNCYQVSFSAECQLKTFFLTVWVAGFCPGSWRLGDFSLK